MVCTHNECPTPSGPCRRVEIECACLDPVIGMLLLICLVQSENPGLRFLQTVYCESCVPQDGLGWTAATYCSAYCQGYGGCQAEGAGFCDENTSYNFICSADITLGIC